MIVYGNIFSHAVMWHGDQSVGNKREICGIFPTQRAAEVFLIAARRDAPSQVFEIITLDDYEQLYCEKINGKDVKEARA